jgi:hypothetical protein
MCVGNLKYLYFNDAIRETVDTTTKRKPLCALRDLW